LPRIKPTRFVFQAVQLVRPCEVVAYRITEAIRSGDVKVGERLPSEQSLSEQLGVSRPTLREATKLLAQAGIVQVLPGSSGGIFVISEAGPPELCGYPLPDLPLDDIDSVLEARRLFEPHVARLASIYATPADFERMRAAVRLSEATVVQFKKRKKSPTAISAPPFISTASSAVTRWRFSATPGRESGMRMRSTPATSCRASVPQAF
jgi:GntR family transcriptional repressor for pyruvate dehydrogenase complex